MKCFFLFKSQVVGSHLLLLLVIYHHLKKLHCFNSCLVHDAGGDIKFGAQASHLSVGLKSLCSGPALVGISWGQLGSGFPVPGEKKKVKDKCWLLMSCPGLILHCSNMPRMFWPSHLCLKIYPDWNEIIPSWRVLCLQCFLNFCNSCTTWLAFNFDNWVLLVNFPHTYGLPPQIDIKVLENRDITTDLAVPSLFQNATTSRLNVKFLIDGWYVTCLPYYPQWLFKSVVGVETLSVTGSLHVGIFPCPWPVPRQDSSVVWMGLWLCSPQHAVLVWVAQSCGSRTVGKLFQEDGICGA